MSTGNPPAGYYADPSVPGYIRYWDGNEWVAGTSRPAPDEVADQVLSSSQSSAGGGRGGAHAGPAAEQEQGQQQGQGQAEQSGAWRPDSSAAGQGAAPQDSAPQDSAARARPRAYAQPQAQQAQQAQPQQAQSQAAAVPQQQAAPQQQAPAQQQYAQPQQQFVPQQYALPQQSPAAQPQPQPYVPRQPVFPVQEPAPQPQPAPQAQPAGESASVAQQIPESVATMVVPSAITSRTGTFKNPFAGLPGSPASFAAGGPDEEREVQTTVVELATPGSRILARIIDTGIAAVFSAPVTGALLLFAHRHDHQYVLKLESQATSTYTTLGMDGLGIALWAAAVLVVIIVSIMLEGVRLGRDGQSYGKRLAGIRVVRMPDGSPLGRGSAGTRRTLLFWVFTVIPLLDILALGPVLWGRPFRQGMHEKATSTVTVKA